MVAWLLVDQLTKTWAERSLTTRNIDVIGSLRFNLAYNTGTAFSLGGGLGPWIAVLALVVVGVLVWQGRTVRTRLGAVALALIVGGALGNIVDRAFRQGLGSEQGFMRGAVVDFIDLQWWPIFNIADVGIVVGGILLVISSLRSTTDDPDPDPPTDTGTEVGTDAAPAARRADAAAADADGPPGRMET